MFPRLPRWRLLDCHHEDGARGISPYSLFAATSYSRKLLKRGNEKTAYSRGVLKRWLDCSPESAESPFAAPMELARDFVHISSTAMRKLPLLAADSYHVDPIPWFEVMLQGPLVETYSVQKSRGGRGWGRVPHYLRFTLELCVRRWSL
ncbi:unnamed protein product, partial [Ectocarpus fasciculatus]